MSDKKPSSKRPKGYAKGAGMDGRRTNDAGCTQGNGEPLHTLCSPAPPCTWGACVYGVREWRGERRVVAGSGEDRADACALDMPRHNMAQTVRAKHRKAPIALTHFLQGVKQPAEIPSTQARARVNHLKQDALLSVGQAHTGHLWDWFGYGYESPKRHTQHRSGCGEHWGTVSCHIPKRA